MSVQLSVVVCTYNRSELLGSALTSLAGQTLGGEDYEVIVVDNNSTDGTAEIGRSFANKYKNFYFLQEKSQGVSHARNRGWQAAQGRYVAFLDDDAKATPDWCSRILQAFAEVSPQPAAVGGSIHPWYEVTPPGWFTDDFEIRTWGNVAGFLRPPVARFGFAGSNMAFPRSILEACGGFDVNLGPRGNQASFGEDSELFFRIHEKAPWFWFDPAIKVLHWVPLRNMTISYRIWRSFQTGWSGALIHRHQFFSYGHLRAILILVYVLLKAPFSVIFTRNNRKGAAVRALQRVSTRLGFVTGCWAIARND